jgi:uncharacterized protein
VTLPTNPEFYAVAIAAITLVGLAKGGLSGMGAAGMPMLALVMDPVNAAGMLLPILLVQDVVGVWAFRKTFDTRLLIAMLPGALVGIFLGWWFASVVSSASIGAVVGAISILFGSYQLLARRGIAPTISRPLPNWFGALFGMASGFTSQVAHAGGPPYQMWTLSKGLPHVTYAGTAAIYFAVLNWVKVPAYLALGQINASTLTLSALSLPLAMISTFAGVWLVRHMDMSRFYTIIYLMMIVVGVKLVSDWLGLL